MPLSSPDSAAAARDIVACRALLRGGSRSFFAASLLLPRRVRDPATALYAFCRLADDAVDLEGENGDTLDRLRERLARVYQGRPLDLPADRAFARVVAEFHIPRTLPEALLEGFAWDAAGRRYRSLAELRAYAARVAGSVGAMMALVMGAREPEILARACDLGVAMQLTNIARDVGEDAAAGRLYLPVDWLSEAGIVSEAWLARPAHSAALGAITERLLREADRLYARAVAGIEQLPLSCRPGIHAARLIYAEIGRELERSGSNSVSSRAVVPQARKARLLPWALIATARPPDDPVAMAPPLAEAQFLVEAVMSAPSELPGSAETVSSCVPWWNLTDQLVGVIELFERLERRDRSDRIGNSSALRRIAPATRGQGW
jgi:phytoene synthase